MALQSGAFGSTASTKFYDATVGHRIYNALGDVVKFEPLFPEPCDDTTGDPTRFTITVTEAGAGDTLLTNSVTAGSWLKLVTDAAEYDGANIQGKGENFKLVSGMPLYFGAKISVDDATQSDLLVGLMETATALLKTGSAHGINTSNIEGVFFTKIDGATNIVANVYKDNASTGSALASTAEDTSAHIYEIVWDGTSQVSFYLDGSIVGTFTSGLPDGDLCPSLNLRAGSAAARTFEIYWMRCFQARS